MAINGFNTKELLQFGKAIEKINKETTKKNKKFMQKEGNKLKKNTIKLAEQRVGEKTGKYKNSIKRGKTYQYGDKDNLAIRVYTTSTHGHLIERGHKMISHEPKKDIVGNKVKEFLVFDDAKKNFRDVYEKDINEFLDELVKDL